MKKYSILLILLIMAACKQSEAETESTDATITETETETVEQTEEYNGFINLDKITADTTTTENAKIDSLFLKEQQIKEPFDITINKKHYYIIEGDLLLDEYEYMQFQISHLMEKDSPRLEAKLVGIIEGDEIVKWPANYIIRYCINRNSFRTEEQYKMVKENLKLAALDWETTCKVKFQYDESKDSQNLISPTTDLTFVVIGYDTRGKFIASSFFPNTTPAERRMFIDPTYFTTRFDKRGVIRHELGHVLGFRHEHIRREAPLECRGESTVGTTSDTPYDPKSVMHYFCGGMGTITLEITDIDRNGSQRIYGAP